MDALLKKRRAELLHEIDVAEALLKHNLGNTNPLSYIPSVASGVVPASIDKVLDEPAEAIVQAESLSKRLLPPDHLLRKILSYLTIGVKGYRLLVPSDEPPQKMAGQVQA